MVLARGAVLAGLLALLVAGAGCSTSPNEAAVGVTTVYLVRHAEKRSDSPDPNLTDAGRARAEALAQRLGDASLTAIYTTSFLRTRSTAVPTARVTGIDPLVYDPRELEDLAQTLRSFAGAVLVVGHSNTTPTLAEHLGAPGFGAIDEATEYDRLYVLSLEGGQLLSARLERYGQHSPIPEG